MQGFLVIFTIFVDYDYFLCKRNYVNSDNKKAITYSFLIHKRRCCVGGEIKTQNIVFARQIAKGAIQVNLVYLYGKFVQLNKMSFWAFSIHCPF